MELPIYNIILQFLITLPIGMAAHEKQYIYRQYYITFKQNYITRQ